jgi:phospholipid/cholesterol/gamma-HCH transport system substrate-binding protein
MTGTDALLAQAQGIVTDVRGITNKLDRDIGGITSDIKGITGELNRFVNGDGKTMPLDQLYKLVMTDLRKLSGTVEEAVKSANHLIKDNDEQFTALVKNVTRISGDIADLTAKGDGSVGPDGGPATEGDIRATMASVRKVADDLSVVTGQLKDVLGDNNDDTKEEVRSLKETIKELNRSLTSLAEVAGRVERGEGTVGRLLTDEKIADKVETAVSGAADYVSSLTSIEAHIDIGTAYNFYRGGTTTTVGLAIVPKPDKYYLIEVVDDGGRLERFTETDQNGNFLRESIRQEDNQLRFTAMFAKKFFDFLVLRVGLLEGTGGAGMDLYFLDNRVQLRSDLFDFRGPRDTLATDNLPSFYLPRWRTQIKAQPIQYVYFSAGIDDVLNSIGPKGVQLYSKANDYGLDFFVGAGLTFKDDDLRSILPFIPK